MKFATILSALAAATLVSAGKFHELDIKDQDKVVTGGFIIEYQDNVSHNAARNALNSRKIDYKVRNEYNIFNGAAITVRSEHNGKDIAALPGVKNVWPITLYSVPKPQLSKTKPTDPEAASLHHMTGVDVIHKKYKLTGKGIKIGVIDTGIDYKHPGFAAKGAAEGCFARYGKNCRVKFGWDFVGDAYTGANTPIPDSDPMDCQGHGSHVAGIIGADATNIKSGAKPPQPFIGVAPEVTLGAYRVFGCKGSAGDDVILAAMELAFNDGMDVINMSLGGGSSYKYNPTAVLGDKLIARGMALAGAAGNDGSQGVWMVSDTGLGELSSSVASFDNAYGHYNSFTYGAVTRPYASSQAYGKAFDLAGLPVVPVFEKNGQLSDGCDKAIYTGLDVKGKVVLVLGDVTRCKSGGRGAVALEAGAAGMIVQTTPIGIAALGGNPNFPMASVENKAGEDILVEYKKNPKQLVTWSKDASNFKVEGGGAPSDFSSFGIDGELRSKPDIAAPGGNILSTYPLAKNGYAVLSGTSMATPYIAGAHAIYMQAKNKKFRGDVIRQVFKNTATISTNAGSKTKASAAKQGAGLVNVLNAILTTTSVFPDHIDLLDTNNLQKKVQITIKNTGKKSETYDLSHIPADSLNSYPGKNSFPETTPIVEKHYASVSFSAKSIKIAAGKSAKITVNFKEPKTGEASQFPMYSGYIVATPQKGNIAVNVPYIGIKGDISKVPIQDASEGFPALLAVKGGSVVEVPKGNFTFDFKQYRPLVVTRLGSHTPNHTIRVFDAQNTFKGYLHTSNAGTASGPRGRHLFVDDEGKIDFSAWIWSGQVKADPTATAATTLPAGQYSLVVASQKKFTKGAYPADYEVFDLGKIQI